MTGTNLPIGYWIKKADELLTTGIDIIQARFKLDRTGWQVLNVIYGKGKVQKSEIVNLLQPFADEQVINVVITKFIEEDIVQESDTYLALTEKGVQLYASCFKEQKLFRQKMMNDISEQDYQQTVSTLQQIVKNLSS